MKSLHAPLLVVYALTVACGDESSPAEANDAGAPSASGQTRSDAATPRDASALARDASAVAAPSMRDASAPIPARFASVSALPACVAGPTLEPVYKHDKPLRAFAILGDQLYLAQESDGLFVMPKDGSAPPKLARDESSYNVAVAGDTLYVRSNIGGYSLTNEQVAAAEEPERAEVGVALTSFDGHVHSWESLTCYSEERAVLSYDAMGEYDHHSLPCPVSGVVNRAGKLYATHASNTPEDDAGTSADGIYAMTFGDREDEPERIVDEAAVGPLTVTATHLYFTAEVAKDTAYLLRAPLAGGSAEPVAGPVSWRDSLVVGGETYLATSKPDCLYRIDAAKNELVPVLPLEPYTLRLEHDGTYLYLGNYEGQLSRVKL
jgi:hypothetical protein